MSLPIPFDVELRRDFEEWLKDVSFGPACPWDFEMSIDSHGFGLWLAFRWRATDRNAPMRDIPGTITGLEFKQVIPVRVRDRASFLDFVYQHAKKIFLHELDESFMVLGVRVKDPHAPYLREEYR